jgi:nicotinamidase-related amidase
MSPADTALLCVDMQEKLLPPIRKRRLVTWNVRRLIDGAKILGIEVVGTEQYPKGLGSTVPELAERIGPMPEKLVFSCRGCPEIFERLREQGANNILVCGIETHVCVQQTVFDLLSDGWRIYLPTDALSSRYKTDHRTALRRMESAGATLTTTEAALFEWCETAGAPEFKRISQLVREEAP